MALASADVGALPNGAANSAANSAANEAANEAAKLGCKRGCQTTPFGGPGEEGRVVGLLCIYAYMHLCIFLSTTPSGLADYVYSLGGLAKAPGAVPHTTTLIPKDHQPYSVDLDQGLPWG